ELKNKIIDGKAANIFISANEQNINELKQNGVLNVNSITTLFSNGIVFATAKSNDMFPDDNYNTDILSILNNIANHKIPLALLVMAAPEFDSLGIYTKEILMKSGNWDNIKDIILPMEDSARTLYMISKGNNVGFIYHSDAYNNPEIKVIAEIEENLYDNVIYWASIVADDDMVLADNFLSFLKSDEVKEIFKNYGFLV
ncbi:MAG: molybdate ABC transporter substrate-binding protein, partial [Pseudomonadota bacterium]